MHSDLAKGTGLANDWRLIRSALGSVNKPLGSFVHTKDPSKGHMIRRACERERGVYECQRTAGDITSSGAYEREGIAGYRSI